jgi:hypothetical protein
MERRSGAAAADLALKNDRIPVVESLPVPDFGGP